jgi:L-lactate dehydrogenase complex protein LldF
MIDLNRQLYSMRQVLSRKRATPIGKRAAMRALGLVLSRTWAYSMGGKLLRFAVRHLPRFILYGPWNAWGKGRELPPMPRKSFRDLIKEELE